MLRGKKEEHVPFFLKRDDIICPILLDKYNGGQKLFWRVSASDPIF